MKTEKYPKVADSADERRDHIARSAASIIASDGLEALTMRAVAAAAGCSRGLVEHYFRNKAGLVDAADAWVNSQAIARIRSEIADSKGLDALEIRLRHILPFSEVILDEWRVRIVFWRRVSVGSASRSGNSAAFKSIYTAIHADIFEAVEAGEIGAVVDAEVVAETVLFIAVGIACSCLSDKRLRAKASLEERVQMILGLLRTGTIAALQFGEGHSY